MGSVALADRWYGYLKRSEVVEDDCVGQSN